ncbi:DUF547 domain-containing protein [Spirosoma sordidisoli]|uniref:DUF547 domain-containing protein n=1 Tax=Spirosoma sordidisoli TaxID=2502893 RepID=A0A4Q2UII5_9BACT|nr:DUF547 domain-containing protein [Spirosoma sordidisoli]RYC67321.1 DUF547 domain-containing protein [Spirosoma sordidisoli]
MKRYTQKGILVTLTGFALTSLVAFTEPGPVTTPTAPVMTLAADPVDHSIYDRLAKKHINEKGLVNYKGFRSDEKELDKYLDLLSKNPPTDKWNQDAQIAYWINAYNAYTIKLILNHYPVKSIKDIGSKIKIPFVTTPWAIKFIPIGSEKISLDNIEHGTLRKKFNDQRIHFALVCAARSCPRLRNEAYTGAKLDAQLDDQGSDFLNNPAKNAISPQKASLSKYFDWYKGDWKEDNKSIEYWVNRYSKTKINKDTDISFLDYNWALNEQ